MNIVIMAGGGGTRLWPLSRQKTPKQFIDLGDGETLVAKVYNRAKQLTDADHIYVATRHDYQDQIAKLLPAVPANNIFTEPEKRDTTAAFASIAIRLTSAGQADQPTIFMWADHVFSKQDDFIADLKKIPELLATHPDHIVIVGHHTLSPDTGLGYMEVGEPLPGYDNVHFLKAFKEKPDLATAEKFVADPNFYWNLGYFSLYPQYLLDELSAQSPDFVPAIKEYQQALATGDAPKISQAYSLFPKIQLEFTLIEKTKRIIAITGDYGWSDVGNWAMVKQIFGAAGDHMPHGHHVHVNSDNNYIYNTTDKTVSLLGIKNNIVVVTDDAILITDADHAAAVKDVVKQLEADDQTDVL